MKNYKLLFISIILLLFFIVGCSENASDVINKPLNEKAADEQPIVVEDEYLLFVEDANDSYSGDLYLKKGINEKEKLSSDVKKYSYRFYPLKEIAVFLDKNL